MKRKEEVVRGSLPYLVIDDVEVPARLADATSDCLQRVRRDAQHVVIGVLGAGIVGVQVSRTEQHANGRASLVTFRAASVHHRGSPLDRAYRERFVQLR